MPTEIMSTLYRPAYDPEDSYRVTMYSNFPEPNQYAVCFETGTGAREISEYAPTYFQAREVFWRLAESFELDTIEIETPHPCDGCEIINTCNGAKTPNCGCAD